MRTKILLGVVVTLACFGIKNAQTLEVGDTYPVGAKADDLDDDDARGERIFAYYTSTSLTRLVTTTITAISTCLSTNANVPPPNCVGRKRRAAVDKALELDDISDDIFELDSSQKDLEGDDEASRMAREIADDTDRSGRKLTIWSIAFTTLTVTSTSIFAGTTVTASILCALAGFAQSCYLG
ncbi:hypothetical protein SK128_015456 [Halocaridina rubra]|uniref:Uncharacterized protein n=1 Tax=Halocaridina rubra TaxID=373956 RepID=A0AAN8WBL7_HALRR